MSDEDRNAASSGAAGSEPISAAARAGQQLRAAREAAGLHLAAVASTIKVPAARLEALEAGQLDQLHDAVFVRALAGSVCRVLKIDPAPVLALLPRGAVPVLAEDAQAINTPFSTPGDATRPSWRDVLTRPGVLVVAALLVGAVILLLLPEFSRRAPAPGPATAPAQSSSPSPESGRSAAVPVIAGSPAGAGTAAAPSAPVVVASEAAAAPAPTPRVVEPGTGPGASPAQASGLLSVTARGTSWVEVVDAAGTALLRRNVEAGERVVLDGSVPMRVTVGRAADVTVQVRGKAFELSPFTRDNVARFEVR